MSKKRLKLASIRKNDADGCPFGLPIPFSCKHIGKNIDRMAPFEMFDKKTTQEERASIADANVRLFAWLVMHGTQETSKCPYANMIFEDHDAVECNYNDTAPGVSSAPLTGAPFYNQVFNGTGFNGLYAYPIGYYADYNLSRNLFYGIFSLQSGHSRDSLLKAAALFVGGISGNKNE